MTQLKYSEFPPTLQLIPYIDCFWELKGSIGDSVNSPERILPNGYSELIFNLADPISRIENSCEVKSRYKSYVVGQSRKAVHIQPQGRIDLFGVSFRTAGAYPFFKQPLIGLTDKIVDLGSLWGKLAPNLEEKIGNVSSTHMRIEVITKALLYILSTSKLQIDSSVFPAVQAIILSGGQGKIGHIADTLSISRRLLEKKFSRFVGISPKSLARITRFQSIFDSVNIAKGCDWASAVFKCGYFDQAHFIKDFKEFCGQTPTLYVETEQQIAKNFYKVPQRAHFYNT